MNKEEIDDWLRYFSNHNHGFMSEDGKKITLFKVFQELKELQQENQQLKERIDKAIEFSNKNWGTWCTHHLEYMTELQDILQGSDNQ